MTQYITLRLIGEPEDAGDVRFGAFIKKLEAMQDALSETDRVISQGERSVDFRVVDLQHASPSTVVLEAVPLDVESTDNAGLVIDSLFDTLVGVQNREDIPDYFDYDALQKFKGLEPTGRGISEVVISRDGDE